MITGSRIGVLAVMDGHRVTGPARQLLASAIPSLWARAVITLGIFQRSVGPTPFITAARCLKVPMVVVRDRFPGDPRTALALAARARAPGIDILQTHGYKANVLARFLAPRLGRPWVAFLHGETWENWKVRAYFALERLAVLRADRIVVVSHNMARRVMAWGVPRTKIRVVHNACLIEGSVHHHLPAWRPEASPLVAVIGRLSPEKGVDVALRVHHLVARNCPEAQLLIAGEGPETVKLQRSTERLGIGSSVQWLGYQEDLSNLYRQIAVLLIPSRSEGLPNVALEAMAHGVPVVATAVGGVPEIISDGHNGFLAPSEDVEGLASRVIQLLEDASLRRYLGHRGREDVASRFSPEARVQALAEIYHEVLE